MQEPEELLKQKIQAFQWELMGLSPRIPSERYRQIQDILTQFVSTLKGRDMY